MDVVLLCLLLPVSIGALIVAIMALVSNRGINKAVRAELERLEARLDRLVVPESSGDLITPEPGPAPATPTPAQPVVPVEAAKAQVTRAQPQAASPAPAAMRLAPLQKPASAPAGAAPATSIRDVSPEAPAKGPSLADSFAGVLQENPFLRWFMGSHVVVRVGIVILFIGVAFLLKYAADQGWLSIELRLAASALLGMALVYGGWYVRNGRRMYALTLQGGGLGIAYLTVFVAFRIYGILPAGFSFGVLVGLGVVCVWLALVNDAKSLAVLAITGGFAAPILISTGEGSHVTLFTYFAILNAAILGIAWYKAWRELNLVGYVFTFVLATLWGVGFYRPEYFATVEPFLILFFLFYVAIGLLYARRSPPTLMGPVDGPLVFGTPLITALWQARLVADFEYGLAWSALAMGLFYLSLAAALFWSPMTRTKPEHYRGLRESYLALGTLFTTLTVPFAFDNRMTAAIWAVEGAALVWLGFRYSRLFHSLLGVVIQLSAGILTLASWSTVDLVDFPDTGAATPVLNRFVLSGLLLALAGLATAYILLRQDRLRPAPDRRISDLGLAVFVATFWGLGWWFATGLLEIVRFAPPEVAYLHGIFFFLVATAALGEWIGRRLSWWALRAPAFLLWIPAGLLAIGQFVLTQELLVHVGWIAWPAGIAVHYWMLYTLDGIRRLRFYHPIGLWLTALLGTLALIGLLPEQFLQGNVWIPVAGIVAPLLLTYGVIRLGQRLNWPTARHFALYLKLGLAPLMVLLVGWSIILDLVSSGDARPLPYLPLLNPLSIAQFLIVVAFYGWLVQLRAAGVAPDLLRGGRVVGLVMIFIWINGDLARLAHHFWHIRFNFAALLGSPTLQAVYSIVWTLLAMARMFFGARRGERWMWLTGAALLGLTVVKLLTVDLSGADTLARIGSFIGVGLLMLLIGYLAPIPQRAVAEGGAGISPTPPPAAEG